MSLVVMHEGRESGAATQLQHDTCSPYFFDGHCLTGTPGLPSKPGIYISSPKITEIALGACVPTLPDVACGRQCSVVVCSSF